MVYMVSKWMGIYGKRWICETRKWKNKKIIASFMAIVYNIHVVVRDGGDSDFFFALIFLFSTKLNELTPSIYIKIN